MKYIAPEMQVLHFETKDTLSASTEAANSTFSSWELDRLIVF